MESTSSSESGSFSDDSLIDPPFWPLSLCDFFAVLVVEQTLLRSFTVSMPSLKWELLELSKSRPLVRMTTLPHSSRLCSSVRLTLTSGNSRF